MRRTSEAFSSGSCPILGQLYFAWIPSLFSPIQFMEQEDGVSRPLPAQEVAALCCCFEFTLRCFCLGTAPFLGQASASPFLRREDSHLHI